MPTRISGHEYFSAEEFLSLFPGATRPAPESIRRYIRSGKLHATKFGSTYIISDSAIAAFFGGSVEHPKAPVVAEPDPRGTRARPKRIRVKWRGALRRECARKEARTRRRRNH